jgi:large repetitive protein
MLFFRLILLCFLSSCVVMHTCAQTSLYTDSQLNNSLADNTTSSGIMTQKSYYSDTEANNDLVHAEPIIIEDDFINAKDDNASTNEDNSVVIDILTNDTEVITTIDPATVDLDTSTPGIQSSMVVTDGSFVADGSGLVTFTPTADFHGVVNLNYTVDDNFGTTSNEATIKVTVNSVNDIPVITGQTPALISATEDQSFTVSVSNLVISDPDNSTFTLIVLSGTNYTFSGTTITPSANYNGPLTINVKVNDGSADSNSFGLSADVAAVNDTPVISGQTPATISATEDQDFSISLSNLTITDPDDGSFTLNILSGTNYSFSGTTITPAPDYSGPLTVNVEVSDGTNTSSPFGVSVNVANVNDAPIITGQTPATISATEDTDFLITVSNLVISDPDNSSFTLTVLAGTNYTFSANTITPNANYNGPLTVNVKVNDGSVDSSPFGVSVNVSAVNNTPVITGQTPPVISATEDTNFAISISNLIISDPDNSSFTLNVLSGSNYTFSGTTITPASNYNGPLTINVEVSDGANTSAPFGISANVTAVNDKPTITGQTPATISATEDTNFTISVSNLTISDPDNSTFTLTVLSGTNYTFSGTTITPSPNISGALTVNVKVNDGTTDSDPFGVTVNVASVNDAPIITGQTPATISANEDQSFSIALSNLTISDPDNASFTLTILSGTNYTFSGTTITPASNYSGVLTVNVKVNDGTNDSAPFGVSVNVSGVNDPPTITGQTPATISATEDTNFTISISNLTISDSDNSTFTLIVLSGTNYTFSGSTITPAANYSGALTINVKVNDGTNDSPSYGVLVNVAPVNDAPVITGQSALSTSEDTPITLALANLTVTDPDNTYPTGFSLSVSTGSNYTVAGSKITPSANFNGTLTVPVTVSDGTNTSNTFNLQITVNAVNDVPVITGQIPLSVNEGQPITLQLSQLVVSDPDNIYPNDFTLLVLSGTNYSVSGNVITPDPNFSGTLVVRVLVNDGVATSAIYNLQITVNAVNDTPVITAQKSLSVNEDNSLIVKLSDLTVTDPDNSFPADFTLIILSGTNYTFSGTTITPSANFNGTLSVSVKVNDGTSDSAPFNLQITVNPVNDAPVITGQQTLSVNEDNLIAIQFSDLTVTDPDNTYPTGFTLSVVAGSNYTFSANTITPAANFTGTLSVQVRVNDGTAFSNTFALQIQVNAINDAPAITGQNSISVNEDNSVTIQLSNLIVSDPDNTYPTGFTLTVISTSNGTLSGNTITPTANFNGTLTASVKVNDGAADSAPHNITVTVNPVNDLPVFDSTPPTVATVGEPYEYLINASDIDSDPLTISALSKPSWAALSILSNGKAKLSGVPTAPSAGTTLVQLRVKDPTGTPVEQSFKLLVNTRPVVSAFEVSTSEDTDINFQQQLFQNAFVDADADLLSKIKITVLPKHGQIKLNGSSINANDEIVLSSISQLTYKPNADYSGKDTLYWNANDSLIYSNADAYLSFVINPVNDAPVIVIESDTLKYEVGKDLIPLTSVFDVIDVDDDSLILAEIGFRQQNYKADVDVITFTNTTNISGSFDSQSGVLTLTGKALRSEYVEAIRGIKYKYTNTAKPQLATKSVYITVSDGKSLSNTKDRFIQIIYTFQDLDILTGFTPNNDDYNDVWEAINFAVSCEELKKNPSLDPDPRRQELRESVTRIFDKSGQIIYESTGFECGTLWDGYYKGKLVPPGSYFYVIEAVDSKLKSLKKVYRGVVTVLYGNAN